MLRKWSEMFKKTYIQECSWQQLCSSNVLETAGMLTSEEVVPSLNETVRSHQYDGLARRHVEW